MLQGASASSSVALDPECFAHFCPECRAYNDAARYSKRRGGVVCQVCGHSDLMSFAELKEKSAILNSGRRNSSSPQSSPAHHGHEFCSPQSSPAHTCSVDIYLNSGFSVEKLPLETDGAFVCPECEAFNDHAHYSRRKQGVVCELCGALMNCTQSEFMRKSADLTKKEEEMQSGVTSLSARTPPQPAEAAAPSSGAEKAAAENLPVHLIMTLGMDFSMAGSEGSEKREKFKRDVAQDLASASGLPAANFRIKDVSPGSIILDMQVMPDPLAPGTHLLAVKDLAEQAADPSSKLRSGKITSHATGVEVVAPTPQAIQVEGEMKRATRSTPVAPGAEKANAENSAAEKAAADAKAATEAKAAAEAKAKAEAEAKAAAEKAAAEKAAADAKAATEAKAAAEAKAKAEAEAKAAAEKAAAEKAAADAKAATEAKAAAEAKAKAEAEAKAAAEKAAAEKAAADAKAATEAKAAAEAKAKAEAEAKAAAEKAAAEKAAADAKVATEAKAAAEAKAKAEAEAKAAAEKAAAEKAAADFKENQPTQTVMAKKCASKVVHSAAPAAATIAPTLAPLMMDMTRIQDGRSKINPAAEVLCDQSLKQFELSYGKEALNILEALHERHAMVNPLAHPKEPYVRCWEEMWSPFEYSRDAQGEAMLKALAEAFKAKNALFEDPMFPAENSSLFAHADAEVNLNAQQTFRKDQDAFLAGVTGIEWKRPREWGDPNDKIAIFSGGIDPDDVAQGRLGNCYYLAAIASCAQGHDDVLLKDLCIEDFADLGMYGVKFFHNGKWVTVVVDDRIPCVKAGNSWAPIFSSPKLHSGQETSVKELWPMIFEKAWAKLHLSYEATAGGLTEDASTYLTGGVLRSIALQDNSDNAHAWSECMRALHPGEGKATAFCSCAVRDGEDRSEQGLITGHAYSILKLVQSSDGKKLVQVRNPWGEHEWKGDYSDNSSLWTAKLKEEAGWEAEEDGAFFMSWEDFTRHFGGVEVCDPTFLSSFTEGDLCRYDVFSSHWVAGKSAGGGPPAAASAAGAPPTGNLDASLFQFNPTAKMSVTADGPVAVTLFLPDTRCMELTYAQKYSLNIREVACHMSSVYITDVTAGSAPKMIVECPPWARQASEITEMKKGHEYHLTAGTFAPGQEGAFWIAVAGHGLSIEPLPFKYLTLPSDSPLLQGMQANYDPYPCCANCHNEIQGSYLNTALGPQCADCNKGRPPPQKIRDPPPGTPSAEAEEAMHALHMSAARRKIDQRPLKSSTAATAKATREVGLESVSMTQILLLSLRDAVCLVAVGLLALMALRAQDEAGSKFSVMASAAAASASNAAATASSDAFASLSRVHDAMSDTILGKKAPGPHKKKGLLMRIFGRTGKE